MASNLASTAQYTQFRQSDVSSYDEDPDTITTFVTALERDNSMDLVNDPRFFNGNVIEKRLVAFTGLNVTATWVLALSVKQLYALKKDFDLGSLVGVLQISSFIVMAGTAFSLIIAVFVQSNQLYYVHRLMTAGPTGFEQASLYYLNKTITRWRHLSVRCLFMGLQFFMVGSGSILAVKFIKDPSHDKSVKTTHDMTLPYILAGVVFAAFCCIAVVLCYIWRVHIECYRHHHDFAHNLQAQLTMPMQVMQYRTSSRTPRIGGSMLDV